MDYKGKGFTLIEILIVLSIVGLLILIGTIGVKSALQFSADQGNKEILAEMNQSLLKFYSEHHAYPIGSCPGGLATDGGVNPDGLLTSMMNADVSNPGDYSSSSTTQPDSYVNDPAYIALQDAMNKYNVNSKNNFAYCSSDQTSLNEASAYILFLKTTISETCKDGTGNNLYMLGSGTYNHLGAPRVYYDIPEDFSLGFSTTDSVQCYKSTS